MERMELVCAVLRVLVSAHAYGNPLPRDVLLNRAAYPPHRGGAAKDAYESIRELEFIVDHGRRGVQLDNSAFGALVQFLYDNCSWNRFELELRIKHFEGWDGIEWNGD